MERIWVGIDEPEDALLSSEDTICIATVADLARDEGGCSKFVVDEKFWSMEVADAARSAEQARHERDEEESNRTAELGTSQVSANKVCDDTQKKLELEDVMSVLRAMDSIRAQERAGLRKTV